MANQPKGMYQIKQVLEHLSRGTSISKIAGLMNMSRNTVKDYRDKFLLTGISFTQLLEHSEVELSLLVKSKPPTAVQCDEKRRKDFTSLLPYFLKELSRTGVTKQLLWQEYLKDFPDGYRYTRFCCLLSENNGHSDAVMRMIHIPGEVLQVDFAGDKLHYIDRETGELINCEVLVSAMTYSHFMHAIALPSQKQSDFIAGLVKAIHYLGAVPHVIKCDNLKSAVVRPDRYTPEFTEAMEYLAAYYGTTAMAARVAKPRDKASVESAVNVCYLRIYAPLRHQTFYSLEELNHAIAAQLEINNDQLLQGKTYSRRMRFLQDEITQMKPLPAQGYQLKKSTWSKVGKNYHVIIGERTGIAIAFLLS
ncbi:MAG: IS21 family transposase [Chitinophagaceae bacterium]|nr:IS21 family transposase [Chitinophagaceae bacterium]